MDEDLMFFEGCSVASGIPDFRSAGGFYETLKPELLTCSQQELKYLKSDPTYVVSWEIFRNNQLPYHEVRKPFILGLYNKQWKATVSHYFMRLCQDKDLLTMVYSQNIDGLDIQAGIDPKKLVACHGTILQAQCEFCDAEYPFDKFAEEVQKNIKNIYDEKDEKSPKESKEIPCLSCKKPGVKPATVLFGRSLPQAFFEAQKEHGQELDILFIAGTSLQVSPANLVPTVVRRDCVRVMVNRDKVGRELGIQYENPTRDVFFGGDCDDAFLDIIEKAGWLKDLAKYKDDMAPSSKQKVEDRLKKN